MTWLKKSIMVKRGVAKGKPGNKHTITEKEQGEYHYVYGPYANPVIHVEPGAVITVETHDAFEGKIKKTTDKPSKILNFSWRCLQTSKAFKLRMA